jgi:polyisoprenoid-binding protein YceI
MKKLSLALAAVLAPALVLADVWTIDPGHSNVNFAVKHVVVSTVHGTFRKFSGTASIDDADLTKSSVDVTIEVGSITTGIDQRDGHLKSADFFDAAKFPLMTFKSTKIEKGGEGLLITGNLTIRGVTKTVVLDATLPTAPIKSPFGDVRRGASARTKVSRKDFGLAWNQMIEAGPIVGDEIKVELDLELKKSAA